MRSVTLLAVCLLSFFLTADLRAADPFVFEAPKGWRSERIPFPLGFAPELKYRGFEELRFGPGIFRAGSDTYWTYVFFWWIDGEASMTKAQLEKDLLDYYRGLSKAVGGSKGFNIDPAKISIELKEVDPPRSGKSGYTPFLSGKLRTYDAFATGNLLELNIEVSQSYFKAAKRRWVFFSVSPRDKSKPVWNVMHKIRDSFQLH